MKSFPDAVEDDESKINKPGPQARGATGYTPTLVPPSVERDELSRNNGEGNTVNSGDDCRPSVIQASSVLHSEDRQHRAQLLACVPEICNQLGASHVTTVKRRLPSELQGATGYTPDGQPRGKPKRKTSQDSFDIHHIAQPPTLPQFAEILSQGTQGINNVSSARTTRPSVTDNNGAEAFLMRAGYELCDIQDYKQPHGLLRS